MNDAKTEIEVLKKAMDEGGRLLNYGTLAERLRLAGFPYQLMQTWVKGKGNVLLYYWVGKWEEGSVYVCETVASKPVAGIRKACERLIGVLQTA